MHAGWAASSACNITLKFSNKKNKEKNRGKSKQILKSQEMQLIE